MEPEWSRQIGTDGSVAVPAATAQDVLVIPGTGLYRQEAEMTQFGANESLLGCVSDYSGGRFNQAAQVFDRGS